VGEFEGCWVVGWVGGCVGAVLVVRPWNGGSGGLGGVGADCSVEKRAKEPVMPMRLFTHRTHIAAYFVGLCHRYLAPLQD
jgi:hypothetical protein